jgi:multicomponent Na+:H+ antiporter subunit E
MRSTRERETLRRVLRSAWPRAAILLGFWVVLIGRDAVDLAAGALTVAAATWVSLRVLDPQAQWLRPLAVPRLAWHFVRQSVVAGVDVARRALDPRLPLHPGFTSHEVKLPTGPLRNAFAALTSLFPGSVVVGDDGGRMLYHCLDTNQSVAAQLNAEETALRQALGGSPT